ncbi:MAG: bifunctional 4-hydroxy-3-methylbut-2-enyl diphosphate reductase/30S ribosomal protein S1, partial [Planctomycetaceae bacterium]|nr:bifunctional 4-hydroxy-3-methylbut-2-enyl diphosphate reductase/30S ribosomal protein S1 [Planctomycetaceae bacterium]
PYVRVSQNYAKLLYDEKYQVVIVGSPDHPEVKGIMSYTNNEAVVVKTRDDLKKVPRSRRRIGVVIQSTMILDHANELIAELIRMGQEVRVFNTICYVTDERQKDAEDVASKSEFVVVVGGAESSNTKKLAMVAQEHGARTTIIERTEELDFALFGDATRIGVLAGASTPNWLIDQVVEKISAHYSR